MILPIVGLILGIALAWFMPAINYDYSKYLAIAVLACLDSVFGGFAQPTGTRSYLPSGQSGGIRTRPYAPGTL